METVVQTKELVSIHHMLLFIETLNFQTSNPLRFNTSHVTLYQLGESQRNSIMSVSIHHMLLFIGLNSDADGFPFPVSIHHMLLFIYGQAIEDSTGTRFNTSHVTLYLNMKTMEDERDAVSIHHMLLFIINPWMLRIRAYKVSIHHMLLFISCLYTFSICP